MAILATEPTTLLREHERLTHTLSPRARPS